MLADAKILMTLAPSAARWPTRARISSGVPVRWLIDASDVMTRGPGIVPPSDPVPQVLIPPRAEILDGCDTAHQGGVRVLHRVQHPLLIALLVPREMMDPVVRIEVPVEVRVCVDDAGHDREAG